MESDQDSAQKSALSLSSTTRKALNDMRLFGLLTDAVLKVEGQRFPVHRAMLATASPFFYALFTSQLRQSKVEDIELKDVPAKIFSTVASFIYLNKIKLSKLSVEKIIRIFYLADYLDIPKLRDHCTQFMIQQLNTSNCIEFWKIGTECGNKPLETSALNLLLRNFETVVERNSDFALLSADDLAIILDSDSLNCSSEAAAYEAIKKWIEWNKEERRAEWETLIAKLRLACVNLDFLLWNIISDSDATNWTMETKNLISATVRHLGAIEPQHYKDSVVIDRMIRPRIPSEILLAIGGWNGGAPTDAVEYYNSRTRTWTEAEMNDPGGPRAYHGLAVLGHVIYMMGGFDGTRYFSSVREFNIARKTWRELGPMHGRRCYVSCATAGGRIFAFGGSDGWVRVNSAESYNPTTNQWTMISSMDSQRSDAHATLIDDRIYMCGGFTGQVCLDSVEYYDLNDNRWISVRPMNSLRSGVGAASVDGILYAVGGFNGTSRLDTLERYDAREDRWHRLAGMRIKRSNFGVEVCEGLVHVAGGFNGSTTVADSECYDPRLNCWTDCTPMSVNRSALYICRLDEPRAIIDFVQTEQRF